jgi:hypothetical protein
MRTNSIQTEAVFFSDRTLERFSGKLIPIGVIAWLGIPVSTVGVYETARSRRRWQHSGIKLIGKGPCQRTTPDFHRGKYLLSFLRTSM